MQQIFSGIYRFFKKRKAVFRLSLVLLLVVMGWGASRVRLEEDITRFFPNDKRVEKLSYVFQNARFVERLVVMVSVKDSTTHPQPDTLVALADSLVAHMEKALTPYVKTIESRVSEEKVMEVFNGVHEHLPVFLDEKDYRQLDSLTRPEVAKETLYENYKQLVSPSGIVMKSSIVKDPLGFSFLVLKKLQHLQYDENFELYDNYIVTRDHRHLVFFLHTVYPPNETGHNAEFLERLEKVAAQVSASQETLQVSWFGASVVAVGNARQLRQDTLLTVGIMIVLLMIVLLGFFRKKRVPFLILFPVAFGALFAFCFVGLIQPSLSVLALAVGAVILGVAVDYSLHYLVHLRHVGNGEQVIRDLARPLTIGSTTTVLAFFCLQFTNAAVLRDIGLFAAFSLIGAALCTLIILPHFVKDDLLQHHRENRMDRLAAFSFESSRVLVTAILLLTPVFLYFAGQVKFNSDMSKLNFMNDATRQAQERLETINKASLSSVYIVSDGNTVEEALRENESTVPALEKLRTQGLVNKISSVSSFLISDSLQQIRIERWNRFWTDERKSVLREVVREEGTKLKFSTLVLNNFDSLLARRYAPVDPATQKLIRQAFFNDQLIEKDSLAHVITLAQVSPQNKAKVYEQLATISSHAFDRQMLTNLFVEYIHADFNFIVTFTSVVVFLALLISYGRIELTLITFVPMLFTWIWILGIMALVGIEFNIVNVMVSTFIFGLGDDYSIFIMDGLQQEYRTGKRALSSVRTSIFLSAVTTICGLGVLIFAEHPALRSIAAISIIGIVCVFIMSQTIEPFLFRILIADRAKKGLTPITFMGFIGSVFTYGFFIFGSFVLTAVGLVLKLIPVGRKKVRWFYHRLLSWFTWSLVYVAIHLKKKIINRTPHTFSRASVIISNHSSFMDILLTTMLHPRLILLTNKWVWNSPVFGGVVRLADYYPVVDGAGDSVNRLKDRIAEGYSVLVFPEGTRSPDGKIGRFHKGAFYMAEALRLPIQPLLIHGAGDVIRKGDMYLNAGHLTLAFLPPIEADDTRFGETYSERAKRIGRYFREEHEKLTRQEETPAYFRYRLIMNYLYKGPVLEWYLRVKLRLEKDYEPFHRLIPRKATILDLGCGYGFLCYMLQFLSEERTITGVDYDEDKIETAQGGYLRTDRLQFYCADVTKFPLQQYDVIIITDVLHYLPGQAQEDLLVRCFKALNSGGKLIVREGNADLRDRHKGTRLTEFFSVKLLRFNKAENALSFVSGQAISALAEKHGFSATVMDDTRYTSNVIFVIQKREP